MSVGKKAVAILSVLVVLSLSSAWAQNSAQKPENKSEANKPGDQEAKRA